MRGIPEALSVDMQQSRAPCKIPQYHIDDLVQTGHKFRFISYGLLCQIADISRTLLDNKVVDHLDVVGASPVGAAPTTS